MDRLTSLSVFGKVIEEGGFSAAARRLNMSVTMVVTHVQSLEARLGVRLLNRTTRKVTPTETGMFYYHRSTQILNDLQDADLAVGALTSTPRGNLRIYSNAVVVRFLLPVLDEFLELYPDVSIDFNSGERMVDIIEDGYDLAIRTVPLPESSLIVRKLTPWRHLLVCSPSYLERHTEPMLPQDIVNHACLQYAYYPHGDEWHFESESGERTHVKVAGSIKSNNAETLRYLTVAGKALWLAPSFVIYEDLAAGNLVRVLRGHSGVEFAINALYPDRNHLPIKVRLFIDLLGKRFGAHRKWMT